MSTVKKLTKDMLDGMIAEQNLMKNHWSEEELSVMKQLVDAGIRSPVLVVKKQIFPGRSKSAIEAKLKTLLVETAGARNAKNKKVK